MRNEVRQVIAELTAKSGFQRFGAKIVHRWQRDTRIRVPSDVVNPVVRETRFRERGSFLTLLFSQLFETGVILKAWQIYLSVMRRVMRVPRKI